MPVDSLELPDWNEISAPGSRPPICDLLSRAARSSETNFSATGDSGVWGA